MVSINIVEIPSRDLQRALAFYAAVFEVELEVSEVDGQRMVFFPQEDESATALAITEGDDYRPSGEGVRFFVTVTDLEGVLTRAVAAGGHIASEIEDVEGWARYAAIRDLEGTVVGLAEPHAE